MPLDPLEQRQLLRAVAELLAQPLGDNAPAFEEEATRIINRNAPAPGKAQKRHFIRLTTPADE